MKEIKILGVFENRRFTQSKMLTPNRMYFHYNFPVIQYESLDKPSKFHFIEALKRKIANMCNVDFSEINFSYLNASFEYVNFELTTENIDAIIQKGDYSFV